MKDIVDWFMNSGLSGFFVTVLSSGAVSAIITGFFTCAVERRKAEARIRQIEAEKQKELETLQVKWEHERNENRRSAYKSMIESVIIYKSMPDIVHKCDAEASIHLYRPYALVGELSFLDDLLAAIVCSSPFDGPDQQTIEVFTKRISALK